MCALESHDHSAHVLNHTLGFQLRVRVSEDALWPESQSLCEELRRVRQTRCSQLRGERVHGESSRRIRDD